MFFIFKWQKKKIDLKALFFKHVLTWIVKFIVCITLCPLNFGHTLIHSNTKFSYNIGRNKYFQLSLLNLHIFIFIKNTCESHIL